MVWEKLIKTIIKKKLSLISKIQYYFMVVVGKNLKKKKLEERSYMD